MDIRRSQKRRVTASDVDATPYLPAASSIEDRLERTMYDGHYDNVPPRTTFPKPMKSGLQTRSAAAPAPGDAKRGA